VSDLDGITYRAATVDDIPALSELRVALASEDDPTGPVPPDFASSFASVVRDGIDSGRWTIWVAEDGSSIVANASVGLIDKIPRPERTRRFIGYLTNVYTRPEYRNRGVGTGLLERILDWASASDVELLVVWPSEDSVPFYRRAGFESGRDPLVWYA
jgi:GNAT superfamily N-acetyltransferase